MNVGPTLLVCVVGGVFACAETTREVESASIEGFDYSIPVGWKSMDQSEHRTKIIVWTPTENERKESIAIMRSRVPALATKNDFARIDKLLVDAQQTLPAASFGPATHLTTKRGLRGTRVSGTFIPHNASQSYQRLHAVLVDGDALLHVVYTAREADRDTFSLVLDSLIRKGA